MATGFSFQVQGLDKLLKVFHELPKETQKELKAELKVTAKEIKDGAKKDAPADESRLKQSISDLETGQMSFEVVAQSFYAGYLEFGTKTRVSIPAGLESIASQLKGPVQGQGSPLEAITAWVKRKGIASKGNNLKQVAYLIWRHIRKYGINPHPYFFKQMQPAEKRLRARLANIIKSLIE
jgi:HK97 gp10 family phage protein